MGNGKESHFSLENVRSVEKRALLELIACGVGLIIERKKVKRNEDHYYDSHHLRHHRGDLLDSEQTGTLIFIFGRFREFTGVISVVH